MIYSDGRSKGDWDMTVMLLNGLQPVPIPEEVRVVVLKDDDEEPVKMTATCQQCRIVFHPNRSNRRTKFCGRPCYGKWMKQNHQPGTFQKRV
jgi:hypothetical protein